MLFDSGNKKAFHRSLIGRKDEKSDMLVKLYLSFFLSSKLIVFRQESKSKFESVVSEPSTSTSSLIYKRVSEKCVLLCKRYIRIMLYIPMDVGLCWYPLWTSSPVPFQYSPEELLFLFPFSGISFPYHFGTKEFSPGLLETPLENRGLSRWSKKKLESSRMLSRCLLGGRLANDGIPGGRRFWIIF